MATVAEHYENLLADHYSWMFGDFDARVTAMRGFFEGYGIMPAKSGRAVDLGAGSGFQSLALAELGFRVVAVDLSRKLLNELEARSGTRAVEIVQGDLLDFSACNEGSVELFVCMGDTLPHMESFERVALLFDQAYRALEAGGRFVLTFRDLTGELEGLDRFIPVRSDADTIFTCFLEFEGEQVKVHDLVYTRTAEGWELNKSWYRKLRIPMEWAVERLKAAGLKIDGSENKNGTITIIASKSCLVCRE